MTPYRFKRAGRNGYEIMVEDVVIGTVWRHWTGFNIWTGYLANSKQKAAVDATRKRVADEIYRLWLGQP